MVTCKFSILPNSKPTILPNILLHGPKTAKTCLVLSRGYLVRTSTLVDGRADTGKGKKEGVVPDVL